MEQFQDINGIKLHYTVEGPKDGLPLILMHGWGCNATTVASIAQTALKCGYRVFSLDLPGHGLSSEPQDVWGIESFTKLVEDFAKSHQLHAPVLIGHSFGGRISILMASRNPGIKKVILVDSAGIKPKRKPKYYLKVYSYKLLKHICRLLGKTGERLLQRYRKSAGSADYNNASPQMRAIMSRCVNEDLKRHMPFINASTLLIWGENDTATPLSDAETMKKLIPDSGLVSFPDAGHYSFLDNPAGFAAVLSSFLRS